MSCDVKQRLERHSEALRQAEIRCNKSAAEHEARWRFLQETSLSWRDLERQYSGNLLRRVDSASDVAKQFGGRVLYISSPPDGSPAELAELVRLFASKGVVAWSPDLVIAQIEAGAFLGEPSSEQWMRWRAGLRAVSSGVFVLPGAASFQSKTVWNDVCSALQCNSPVWVVRP